MHWFAIAEIPLATFFQDSVGKEKKQKRKQIRIKYPRGIFSITILPRAAVVCWDKGLSPRCCPRESGQKTLLIPLYCIDFSFAPFPPSFWWCCVCCMHLSAGLWGMDGRARSSSWSQFRCLRHAGSMPSKESLQRIELGSLRSCTGRAGRHSLQQVKLSWDRKNVLAVRVVRCWHRGPGRFGDAQNLTGHSLEQPDLMLKLAPLWAGVGVETSCQPQPFSVSLIYRSKLSVIIKLSFYRSIFIMKIHCLMSNGISEHSLFRKNLSSNYTRS